MVVLHFWQSERVRTDAAGAQKDAKTNYEPQKRSECDEVSQTNEKCHRKYQQEHTDMAKKNGKVAASPKK